jgi:hypothetical protein
MHNQKHHQELFSVLLLLDVLYHNNFLKLKEVASLDQQDQKNALEVWNAKYDINRVTNKFTD